ncbi:hypothetical protein [Corynebacterium lubricantis]|uniref:hypothetical protein n=1 Tax=Corynebacterium lubricantis TaxID=541095 RepID=UPI00036F0532|nr:hypothetical protein [Corynebacterium lubricantis]
MTDFLADRLAFHDIAIRGISPYGFGTPGTFWELPEGWDDVTQQVTESPVLESGVMLLSEAESNHAFHQNIATYAWVLDGSVPFRAIFEDLTEPTPDDAADVETTSVVDKRYDHHAQASLNTRFVSLVGDEQLQFYSATLFNWWPLDTKGKQTPFKEPSLLIQRTLVAVDEEQTSPLPGFRELPENLEDFTAPDNSES